MDRYTKIRNVIDDALLTSITNHKGLRKKTSDELTRVVREICGLE